MTAGCAVTWLGHATVRVDLDGVRVLTDPLLTEHLGPLRRRGGVPSREAWHDVDVAVISHLHYDHLDLRSLRMLDRGVTMVVPRGRLAGRASRVRSRGRVD